MHRMVHNQSSFVLHNDPSLIPLLLGYLQQVLRCVQLEDELDRLRIRLAVEEALLNALYRGNLEISPQLQQADREVFRPDGGGALCRTALPGPPGSRVVDDRA